MDKQVLQKFLLLARTKTYAAATGKTDALLPGSVQYEYSEGDFVYRDIYYLGNGLFPGLEIVFYRDKPVWGMSYFGDFSQMTEEQTDKMLRRALVDHWETARSSKVVEKDYGEFRYVCRGSGTLDELSGVEEIELDGQRVHFLNYAGGYIGTGDTEESV